MEACLHILCILFIHVKWSFPHPYAVYLKTSKKPLTSGILEKLFFLTAYAAITCVPSHKNFPQKWGGCAPMVDGDTFFLPQEEALIIVPSGQAIVQPLQASIVTMFNRRWRHDPRKTRRKPRRRRHPI